ncbi:MAG TPA: outer membrane protein transport protein [Burkholderiales bacterium]|nr:outer membrane protein transport protein [Burkholderiales bacterium]
MARIGIRKTALSLAVAGAFAGGVSQAHASAFALIEQSASGLGNSFAGAAAAAEDASTIFYNPAGMSLLPGGMQVSAGLALINLSAKFSDSGSTAPPGIGSLGGNGGNAGGLSAVPNVYFAMDVAPSWKVGVGVSVPFGLKTEYDPTWVGRFQAIKSDISTLNINPSVSYKLDDKMSFGFGLNYQQIDAELSRAIVIGPGAETVADVKGKDNSWGFNFGAMFQPTPDTRLGVSYRSLIKYNVSGTVNVAAVPALNGNANVDIKMPDTLSIALNHRLDSKWTLLGDVTRTGWSKIKDLTIVTSNGQPPDVTQENFKNTWRVGVGAVHRYDDAWSIKMGLAFDQSPVNDTDRTPRLPDNNRLWLSVGGQYKLSKAGTLDFGYAHLFIKDAPINQLNPVATTGGGQLVGTYKGSVDIFGAQFAYRF